MAQLPRRLGQPVEVTLHGGGADPVRGSLLQCVTNTVWECVCSCAGRFHGTRSGPPKQLADGLAVATDYTTHTFTCYPQDGVHRNSPRNGFAPKLLVGGESNERAGSDRL